MPRRSKAQQQLDRLAIADGYLKGRRQVDLAKELDISQQRVSQELMSLQEEWQEQAKRNIDERKSEELAKIDELERSYWAAWEKSTSHETISRKGAVVLIPADKHNPMGDKRYLEGVQWCIQQRTKILGIDLMVKREIMTGGDVKSEKFVLPAFALAPSFLEPYRDVTQRLHTEYVFQGGRGSTKSSFVALAMIEQLINQPEVHALVLRQVFSTCRDSVFAQLLWAISYLGLEEKFSSSKNPLEITYLPTKQKIFFRGADDPLKIKSIKPPFGYIGMLWFEELDQFHGAEAVRSIEQSAIRGGEGSLIFKTFNPPRSKNNWTFKYLATPKPTRLVHTSTYLTVPREWLGSVFIDEAEFLKEMNPPAYEHEYLGVANSTGGLIFDNTILREITKEEIETFNEWSRGIDWGYFPDPAHYVECYYNPAQLKLYIFGEVRAWKTGNKEFYNLLVEHGLQRDQMVICDSAEPKSIGDMREYGMSARGAIKGADSVKYGIKWLQSLVEIVIDPQRCPYTAEEFLQYEHEIDKNGEFISSYPDYNNHGIDAVRYATNPTWRRRGT